MGEFKNMYVKIPLLQVIKDVSIDNNLINEECFKRSGRRKRDAPTINFVGKLSDLLLGKVISQKCLDLGSLIEDVNIGSTINVMNKETMLNINLQGALRKTTKVLQLADRSIITLEEFI